LGLQYCFKTLKFDSQKLCFYKCPPSEKTTTQGHIAEMLWVFFQLALLVILLLSNFSINVQNHAAFSPYKTSFKDNFMARGPSSLPPKNAPFVKEEVTDKRI
jgi:hypothetical protein